MKILIIAEDIGETAPGIVFERILRQLAVDNELTFLVANYKPEADLSGVIRVVKSNKIKVHPRINELFISLFGVDPLDLIWAVRSLRKLYKTETERFDLVFSFLSYSHYGGIIAGNKYVKYHNTRFGIYSVDAIPAPEGWFKVNRFYQGLESMIKKYLSQADFFFSSNPQMLNYQLKKFIPKNNLVSGVILTPGLTKRKVFPNDWSGSNKFIYTGGIYGPRKADYLIEGFDKLLKKYPDSKLQFVGTQITDTLFKFANHDKVEFLPFTADLDHFYKEATALIDIDGEIDDDVFLSSKIASYLMVNRIIISETGLNSPSRHIFKGIESIIQCEHNSDQMYIAMQNAIEMRSVISFEDRENVIKLFSADNITRELKNTLSKNIN